MKNLFIFIYNNLDDNKNIIEYTKIIDYYKSHYENFIVVIQNNNININFINIIKNHKCISYFELENNNNIHLFVLNNLNNMDYENYIFLYGNLFEYNDEIINELDKNKIYKKKFDVNKFNLNSNIFSYIILDKNDIYEIKKKYLIL